MSKNICVSTIGLDLERLDAVCAELGLSRSRAIAVGINFLHSLMERNCRAEELTYDQVVLTPEGGRRDSEKPAPVIKKRCGWPKGKKRGPRKPVERAVPALRVVK